MNLLMESASVSKKSWKALLLVAIYREIEPTPNQDSQKEMKPASWLSKLLAGAKIHHPYRKPDTHTFRQRSPNWKADGSPRRASQHFRKSLKSPWTERRQTRGSYKQRAERTSDEIILKSWLAGWWGWWGYVRIVDMVRVARMVRMVRMFSKSSESRVHECAKKLNSWDKVYRNAGWIHFLKVIKQVFVAFVPPISIHFLNVGNSREESPLQMTTQIQYQRNKELETVCWNLLNKTVQEHRIILAAELEEAKNHLSAHTKSNYVSPQPSSTLSKPSTMKLLMELASVSKKLNQHQPWFPEGNEVEPASWLSTVIY